MCPERREKQRQDRKETGCKKREHRLPKGKRIRARKE
jgi:hypothetical protein